MGHRAIDRSTVNEHKFQYFMRNNTDKYIVLARTYITVS
jgi:hypothetical protein